MAKECNSAEECFLGLFGMCVGGRMRQINQGGSVLTSVDELDAMRLSVDKLPLVSPELLCPIVEEDEMVGEIHVKMVRLAQWL